MQYRKGLKKRNALRRVFIFTALLVVLPVSVATPQGMTLGMQSEPYVELWVGRGCGEYYNDEELVDICFNVHSTALSATIAIMNYPPHGSSVVWINTMPVTTNEVYCIYRKADCPEGLNLIKITATVIIGGNPVVVEDECKYYVRTCKTYDYDKDGYISFISGGDDCDDSDSHVYPGAEEICDGKDNKCNGFTDEGVDCNYVEIWVNKGCNASYSDREQVEISFNVHSSAPSAVVTITDYLPQSADILVKDRTFATNMVHTLTKTAACPAGLENLVIAATVVVEGNPVTYTGECSFHVTNCQTADSDGDGFTAVFAGGDDCDDSDPAVYPGAAEVCDQKDNNCDGATDEGFDTDGDGYTLCGGDCDDTDPAVNPRAAEVCDGKDNNCDGATDEGFSDNDQDGYTDCGGDCDDADPNVNPGVPEVQDGRDTNCDGQIDNIITMDQVDNDLDSFSLAVDCNDRDPSINPGASELCSDGKDNDCDGLTDCNDEECQDDSACKTGITLPSIDITSIIALVNRYKFFIAGGASGVFAVILVVYLLRRRKKRKEEILPIEEKDVTFPDATKVKDKNLEEAFLDRLEGKSEEPEEEGIFD